MPRPSRDGRPARPTNKRNLSDRHVRSIVPDLSRVVITWDARQPGLCVAAHPSGKKVWRIVYRRNGRPVWVTLGDARSITLADARKLAARVALEVAVGKDPAAERRAERAADTFAALAERYVREWASKRNKSWKQTDAIIKRSLLPRWGRLKVRAITRAEVRSLIGGIAAPAAADAALAAASQVFSFGVQMEIIPFNPALGVARSPKRSRERVLTDDEIALLWPGLCPAFRLILLTGARPGEIFAMRKEDISSDGIWSLPGEVIGDWPGTKSGRGRSIPLSAPAMAIVEEHLTDRSRRRSEARLKRLWQRHEIEQINPHDLRRTNGTMVTRLGLGRLAMSRLLGHADNSVSTIYDRHSYRDEDRRAVDAVARHIIAIVEGTTATENVVRLR